MELPKGPTRRPTRAPAPAEAPAPAPEPAPAAPPADDGPAPAPIGLQPLNLDPGSDDDSPPPPEPKYGLPEDRGDDTPATVDEGDATASDSAGETPTTPTATQPHFDESLLAIAEQAGFTRAEALAFQDPAHLERALIAFARKMGTSDKAPGSAPADDDFKIDLDPELYDPAVVSTVNGLKDHFKGKVGQLQEQVRVLTDFLTQQETQKFENDFYGWVSGLGAEYESVLGKGRGRDLDRSSDAFEKRMSVLEQMDTLAAGYTAKGKRPPAPDQLFKQAVSVVFSDQQTTIAEKKLSSAVEKRRSQFVARPTQRTSKAALTPEDEARGWVRQFLAEKDR